MIKFKALIAFFIVACFAYASVSVLAEVSSGNSISTVPDLTNKNSISSRESDSQKNKELTEEDEQDDSFANRLEKIEIPENFSLPEIVLGKENAPHTLVIYSSFTCNHCCSFHKKELQTLINKHVKKGNLKIYLKNYIDDMGALDAAVIMRALGEKKKNDPKFYIEIYRLIYDKQKAWMQSPNPREFLKTIFTDAGFSREEIDGYLEGEKNKTYIRLAAGLMKEQKSAMHQWRISSVPAFIIDGAVHTGILTAEEIEKKFINK